ERSDREVTNQRLSIDQLRTQHKSLRRDIESRFPGYIDLINPRPATVDDIRAALKPDEAFLSFYLGRRASFVWAVPKAGQVSFAYIATSAADIDDKVHRLREALEPNAATISDIPPFDVALAHELYT